MYVTRPLSLCRNFPDSLSLYPTEGPNSGYLVIQDEEYDTTCCCFTFKDYRIRDLPFPQNKDLTVHYSTGVGENQTNYNDDVIFIPVLNQPLSSNQYYVIKRDGRHKGEAFTNSKDEDKVTCCCCTFIPNATPKPLDPSDVDQQVEIIRQKRYRFHAKSVAPDGFPPDFLRREGWSVKMSKPRHYQLSEAQGLDISLRARLPNFNFSLSNESSETVVVGKWYCPFMFVKEEMKLKDQMKISSFYEMTLEQRWVKFFARDGHNSEEASVLVDVVIQTEGVSVAGGVEAVWDERNVEDGVIWYKSSDSVGGEKRVGLNLKVVERMKWEQQRVGWIGGEGKQVRVERVEKFGGIGKWVKFGCYVLVERFVLKRIDGSLALIYDFKHPHQIRSKWE